MQMSSSSLVPVPKVHVGPVEVELRSPDRCSYWQGIFLFLI